MFTVRVWCILQHTLSMRYYLLPWKQKCFYQILNQGQSRFYMVLYWCINVNIFILFVHIKNVIFYEKTEDSEQNLEWLLGGGGHRSASWQPTRQNWQVIWKHCATYLEGDWVALNFQKMRWHSFLLPPTQKKVVWTWKQKPSATLLQLVNDHTQARYHILPCSILSFQNFYIKTKIIFWIPLFLQRSILSDLYFLAECLSLPNLLMNTLSCNLHICLNIHNLHTHTNAPYQSVPLHT